MPLHQVIFLAVLQGVTEFLPISSSAHLALTPWLLGWKDQTLTFDIALHFGTLSAILLYFHRDWMRLTARAFGRPAAGDPDLDRNPRLFWFIALATIPVGAAGLLFKEKAEEVWRLNHLLIGSMLILVGLLMLVAERMGRRRKGLAEIGLADSMIIGTAQALALVPGTSRSGITITAALFRDIDRASAARFSFLLSTPAIAAAALKAFLDLMRHGGITPDMRTPFVVGIVVSAAAGCGVIAFFLRFLREHTLKFFIYYRVISGIIVIVLATFFRTAG